MIDIDNIFKYHPPVGTQALRYESMRLLARTFAEHIMENTPSSAEQTLAIRHLQMAVMFANAAIAINESVLE